MKPLIGSCAYHPTPSYSCCRFHRVYSLLFEAQIDSLETGVLSRRILLRSTRYLEQRHTLPESS
ncbi:hypothetical protein JB92DRAFT_2907869 [Gautieria morchelliformis]|nr:hypothetical protein JB92DRAFT_2907869 [Gautieria morchelliformis]